MVLADTSLQELQIEQPGGTMLVRPEYAPEIAPAVFEPEFWGRAATPVSVGGRGRAWFISEPGRSWVLRHYCRGGLVAKVSHRSYLFSKPCNVRAFREFRLLSRLYDAGLPVPMPVAARFLRTSKLFYQAAIVVERVPDAVTFAECLDDQDLALWRRAGAVVRLFHDHGVYHADLNCNNILVTEQQLYLIDFDKGEIRPEARSDAAWKTANLERLKRSVVKLLGEASQGTPDLGERWQALLQGYRAAAEKGAVR